MACFPFGQPISAGLTRGGGNRYSYSMAVFEKQDPAFAEKAASVLSLAARVGALADSLAEAAPSVRETVEKARLIAETLLRELDKGGGAALFLVFRMLSLLGRALDSFGEAEIRAAGLEAAGLVEAIREFVSLAGERERRQAPAQKFSSGAILPPERLEPMKPGKVLLALEPALAAHVAAVLERFGHQAVIIRSAAELFSALGFVRDSIPAESGQILAQPSDRASGFALSLRRAEGGGLCSYSLPRAAALSSAWREALPDVLIGDMVSAGFAGFELQEYLKLCWEHIDTRVIVLSPFNESKCTARVIQLGSDGFFSLDVEPSVLLARIESSMERRRLKSRRKFYAAALASARESLEEELRRGAEYVRCLLPGKIASATLSTDWVFIPSASLGGDLFGYHRLDDGRMVFFMIDVSGHGVQSALHSVAIFDVLRTEGLKEVDFGDPASVMKGLNHAFRMEERNNMLFTLWYGVWDEKTRVLVHSSAGSPPAVLIVRGGGAIELKAEGMVAGADPEADYQCLEIGIPKGSRLFLFSDGIYEFLTKEASVFGLESFVQLLEKRVARAAEGRTSIGNVLEGLAELSVSERFRDDVSLLEVRFD